MTRDIYKIGYQGSETSSVAVFMYPTINDPIVMPPNGVDILSMSSLGGGTIGTMFSSDPAPKLLGVDTNKVMGAASGTFTITVKPSREMESLFNYLIDDNWVDIVFYRHDQPWHVMRGLIDEIQKSTAVVNGATTETYTITGRDFGKVWEITPVWFSPYAEADIVSQGISHQVFQGMPELQGSPAQTVQAFMKKFLEVIRGAGPDIRPPDNMPGMLETFLGSVSFNTSYFQNVPPRRSFSPNALAPNGTLWSLAQQYSDPMFCELYVDQLPGGDPYSGNLVGGSYDVLDTTMTVVLRDKPFPVVTPSANIGGFVSEWDNLPMFELPRQQIVTANLGRGGAERYNTYFVAGLIHQESGMDGVKIIAPILNKEDVYVHGIRRMDIQTLMAPDNIDMSLFSEQQRRIIRDWYCMNPYYYNGTINIGIGRPDIKIGCKVRIPGAQSEEQDETYYVEQVSHSWRYGSSTKTTLGVTRGFIGRNDIMLANIQSLVAGYSEPAIIPDSQRG